MSLMLYNFLAFGFGQQRPQNEAHSQMIKVFKVEVLKMPMSAKIRCVIAPPLRSLFSKLS